MIPPHFRGRFLGVVAIFEVMGVAVVKSGRPGLARAERVVFWEGVRGGLEVADAARAAGIGSWSGRRLFGEAGGVKGNGPMAGSGSGPHPSSAAATLRYAGLGQYWSSSTNAPSGWPVTPG